MYNESIKRRFINECTDSINTAATWKSMFESIQKFEEEWGGDICTQNIEAIQPMLDQLSGSRSSSVRPKLSLLRSYARWCVKNQVPNANLGILKANEAGINTVERLKKVTVSGPVHLELMLDKVFDPTFEKTVHCLYRSYFWLAFAGMKSDDIFKVRSSDVCIGEMVVYYKDYEYPLYREGVPAIYNTANLDSFKFIHPHYFERDKTFIKRAPSELLMRGIRDTFDAVKIRECVGHAKKKCKEDVECLTHSRVWLSGLFYRMYEDERSGLPVDFYKAAKEQVIGKIKDTDNVRSIDAKIRTTSKNFHNDYENWKLAFAT